MKNLFMVLLLLMPIGLTAQTYTVVTDPDTGLKYVTEDTDTTNKSSWYIYLASGNTIDIQIDGRAANVYFAPHSNFRIYLRTQCDNPSDGKIYWNKLQETTSFPAAWSTNNGGGNAAVNYKGIEYFPNLTSFTDANSSSATSIVGDFSKNTKLSSLTFSNSTAKGKITSLDISNTAITSWTAPTGATSGFTLTAKNSALTSLNIASSNVSDLDVSGSANLATLTTRTSNSSYLKKVDVSGTNITSLNLYYYTGLQEVIFDKTKLATWGTGTSVALRVPSGFIEVKIGDKTHLIKNSSSTELTIDVTNETEKDVDISALTNLQRLNVIGATSVTLPDFNRTNFILDGTGSPDLVVDFGSQTKLTSLTLININEADISGCEKVSSLTCQGREWGDGTDGHAGIICNTGATSGSWTLPALTTIIASESSVPKIDLTNAGANLTTLNLLNTTTKELRIPNHTNITSIKNTIATSGLMLGYSSVDTLNYHYQPTDDATTNIWYEKGENFYYNQLEVIDISGCSNISGAFLISGNSGLNYNESPLRELNANGCSKISKIQIYNASLEAVDVRNCSAMTHLWVEQSRLRTVDFTGCPALASVNLKRNSLTDMDFLTMPCEGRTADDIAKLYNIQLNGGASATIMKVDGAEKVIMRDVFSNKISNFNTTYLGSALKTLSIADNLLQTIDMHERMSGITSLSLENNMLITLDLSKVNASVLTHGNWGWDMSKEKMQVAFMNVEEVKGYEEDGSQDWVALPLPNGGGFEHLLDNTVKLFPSIEDAMAGTNEIAEEANPFMGTVDDFNTRVGHPILCPTGHLGEHLFLHSQDEIIRDAGKIADQDLYDKVLIYKYKTGFNGNNPKGTIDNHIEIRAHIWPYILNINPVGKKSGSSTTGIDYYVATLCLDYDAIIPYGVTLHVPVGVKEGYKPKGQPESSYVMQFDMKEVGTPGMVLPKNTPVVVKSTQAAGLYSFQTAWDFDFKGWEDYRQDVIKEAVAAERGCDPDDLYPILHGVDEDNIIYKPAYDPVAHPDLWVGNDPEVAGYLAKNLMCGTQETMPCARKSILALGRQNAPGPDGVASLKVGFWRLNALSLPAHRCYILPEKLKEAMEEANLAGAKDGGLFYFDEYDTTAIRTIETEVQSPQKDDVVYDLQGRRITGKPVPGIYIVNGKKVVIK